MLSAQRGYAAFNRGDFASAEAEFAHCLDLNPADDIALYMIAVAQDHRHKPESAAATLRSLVATSCLVARPQSFVNTPNAVKFAALRTPPVSTIAFTIPQKDLVPEGIAYDSVGQQFFVSSTRHRKIVRLRAGPRGAVVSDFVPDAFAGLRSVLGLKVDAARGELWVVSSGEPGMIGYTEADDGQTAIYRFAIGDAHVIRTYSPPDPGQHFFNDLVVAADGTVYITDSLTGAVYVIRQGEAITPFLPAGTFVVPNGVALSSDQHLLYVADTQTGTFVIDLKDRIPHLLWRRGSISTSAVDGLYFHDGSLVGVENAISRGRVVRFHLTRDLRHLASAEVLDCAHPYFDDPTTGTIVGDTLYYIGNSQYRRLDGNYEDVVILARSLARWSTAANLPNGQIQRRGNLTEPPNSRLQRTRPAALLCPKYATLSPRGPRR